MKNHVKEIMANTPKFMLGVIALSLVLQEFYPLSHFPMYSTFGSRTHYVYLADHSDQPIAVRKYFKYSTPKLKKMFVSRINHMKRAQGAERTISDMRKEAAHSLLAYLLAESDRDKIKLLKSLRLYVVDIKLEDKELTRTPTFLAEVEL